MVSVRFVCFRIFINSIFVFYFKIAGTIVVALSYSPTIPFSADHPFSYAIVDGSTNTIQFLGRFRH